MPRSPEDRRRIARTAALHRSATEDTEAMTRPARTAFLDRFTPDDPELSPAERDRRARAALRLHMSELSQLAAQARRQARAAQQTAEQLAGQLDQLADEAV